MKQQTFLIVPCPVLHACSTIWEQKVKKLVFFTVKITTGFETTAEESTGFLFSSKCDILFPLGGELRYWPPFSMPDIGNPLQRFSWPHSDVISAAGGCQYLAVKMLANTEGVSALRQASGKCHIISPEWNGMEWWTNLWPFIWLFNFHQAP
jgi:hypothetical protein